jgi:hypothetical protein
MSSIFAKAVLIGVTAIGAVTVATGPAAAQSNVGFSLFIGQDNGAADDDDIVMAPPHVVRVWGDDDRYGAPPPPPPPYWDRPHRWDGPRYAPPPPPPPRWGRYPEPRFSGVCAPGDAIRQARRDGLRHPYIDRVTPRSVVVSGRRYGEFDRVILINRPGCPYAG